MLEAGEPFGHVRDLLLLLTDEDTQALDHLPRVLGGDQSAVVELQRPQAAARFEGSQNSSGACEDGIR
jgi:hypothetical protein